MHLTNIKPLIGQRENSVINCEEHFRWQAATARTGVKIKIIAAYSAGYQFLVLIIHCSNLSLVTARGMKYLKQSITLAVNKI